jgi:UDP-N-acetylmuramate dehydrogenase
MEIKENISLQAYNSFGVDSVARFYTEAHSIADWEILYKEKWLEKKFLVLGGGSNMLFLDNYHGLVIRQMMLGVNIVKEDEQSVIIRAKAGEPWHALVSYTVSHGWAGIENLSLIPGNVGAAPIQNIGAYGVELEKVFVSLDAMEIATGNIVRFNKHDCKFGYRSSVFKNELKGQYVIMSVTIELSKLPVFNTSYGAIRETIKKMNIQHLTADAVSKAVIRIRESKLPDPDRLGNAGSFFKNPTLTTEEVSKLLAFHPSMPSFTTPDGYVKVPAAWLIEQCGWKGKREGKVGCHADQALVIVNYGGATGKEIWSYAKRVQASVLARFGILLEPEVNIVSEPL